MSKYGVQTRKEQRKVECAGMIKPPLIEIVEKSNV
jgi:hypothetical protein